MKREVHIILQCLLVFMQFVVPEFPVEWQKAGHAVLGGMNAVLGILAHELDPKTGKKVDG